MPVAQDFNAGSLPHVTLLVDWRLGILCDIASCHHLMSLIQRMKSDIPERQLQSVAHFEIFVMTKTRWTRISLCYDKCNSIAYTILLSNCYHLILTAIPTLAQSSALSSYRKISTYYRDNSEKHEAAYKRRTNPSQGSLAMNVLNGNAGVASPPHTSLAHPFRRMMEFRMSSPRTCSSLEIRTLATRTLETRTWETRTLENRTASQRALSMSWCKILVWSIVSPHHLSKMMDARRW